MGIIVKNNCPGIFLPNFFEEYFKKNHLKKNLLKVVNFAHLLPCYL